jgi:holo-[acyl-carrier protein] synthase
VLGLGIDLVELDRVDSSLQRWGDRLVGKLMDAPEARALPPTGKDRVRALAQSIAAKEAASKAIGTGWSRGVRWRDVVLEGNEVRLTGRALEAAARLGSSGRSRLRLELLGNLVVAELRLLA